MGAFIPASATFGHVTNNPKCSVRMTRLKKNISMSIYIFFRVKNVRIYCVMNIFQHIPNLRNRRISILVCTFPVDFFTLVFYYFFTLLQLGVQRSRMMQILAASQAAGRFGTFFAVILYSNTRSELTSQQIVACPCFFFKKNSRIIRTRIGCKEGQGLEKFPAKREEKRLLLMGIGEILVATDRGNSFSII